MANILITGGSGYLGGDLLAYLNTESPLPRHGTIYGLIRSEEQATQLKTHYNVTPLTLDLSDQAAITSTVLDKKISIVFYLIDFAKPDGQLKFMQALTEVNKRYGLTTHLLHTTGAKLFSNFLGFPTDRSISDVDPDVFDLQTKTVPKPGFEMGKTASDTVCHLITRGEEMGVRVYIFAPCIVYGESASFGNKVSIQTKCVVKSAKALRRVIKPDNDNGTWPVCHVRDNSKLYAHLLTHMIADEDIPHGKKGVYLASPGSLAWIDIYAGVARAMGKRGLVDSTQIAEADDASLIEAAEALDCAPEQVSLQMGGICTFEAENGNRIGWKAGCKPEHLLETIDDEHIGNNTATVESTKMLSRNLLRQTARAAQSNTIRRSPVVVRSFANSGFRLDKSSSDNAPDNRHDHLSTAGKLGEAEHEGEFSRTDNTIAIEHPAEEELPTDKPTAGGHLHFKRTLEAFSLEGNVGLVTGGARGLGLIMSQALVFSGADVAIVDLNKDEAAKQAEILMQTYRDANPGSFHIPRVTAHYADVSDQDSVQASIGEIIKEHHKIDHLVTSAGFTENFDAIAYPFDRVKKLWGVNVDGTYLYATAVAKHLMDRKASGSMVFIGSMSGSIVNVPQPQTPYNASKAAVRHLAASLAVEWAHAGIRVNCISPGYMLTALTKKILDENPELAQKWISLIPQGKMGRPEDLMGAVTFLLSPAAGYVTGADLRVDGGYTVT